MLPRPGMSVSTTAVLRAVVILYAVVAAGMALSGSYFFITKTAVLPVLCLAALVSRRFMAFVYDWSVFIGLTMLFDAIRGLTYALIAYVHAPVYMSYAIRAERAVLHGAVLPELIQRTWAHGRAAMVLDPLMLLLHASHFVFFLGVGLAIWLRHPEAFPRYRRTMVLVMYVGLGAYLLIPTVPPWMAATDYRAIGPVESIALRLYTDAVPTLTAALATNPIAAMPSLHAAFPAACSLLAIATFGRRAWWTVAYACAVALAVMYLGEHYFVDVLAGWMLGAGAYWLVGRPGKPSIQDLTPIGRRRSLLAVLAITAALVAASQVAGLVKAHIERSLMTSEVFLRSS